MPVGLQPFFYIIIFYVWEQKRHPPTQHNTQLHSIIYKLKIIVMILIRRNKQQYIFSHYDESLHECIFVDSLGKSYNVEADKLGYVHKENL